MLESEPLMAFLCTMQPERALAFYRDGLGLRFVEDTPYALVFEASGTTLRIQKVQQFMPHQATALGWLVADIRSAIAELTKRGITFSRYDYVAHDELGIWTTPEGAQVAWFIDPDGNILSLTQSAPQRQASSL